MKHVKNLIEKMLEENKNKKKETKEKNLKEKIGSIEEIVNKKKGENDNEIDNDFKDISFDNIVIPINKSKIKIINSKENNKSEDINNDNNPV